jgi:hypothetical protein
VLQNSSFATFFESKQWEITFENNPLNRIADSSLKVRAGEMLANVELGSLFTIANCFKTALSEKFDLTYYKDAAT